MPSLWTHAWPETGMKNISLGYEGAVIDKRDMKMEENIFKRVFGVVQDFMGLPAGVKFDPTDQQLIEHLEAKAELGVSRSHPLIDEFIPTIEGEDGICYTHPDKLPGVTRDGLSRHFFHRPSKAYTTGTRKRRKIQEESDLQSGETRWHKTGKTRPVMVSGKQKGCKKILVLYTNFGKHRKPRKTNWVMHQYHLGQSDEEREGELVVSKVFYQTQPRQCNWACRIESAKSVEYAKESGSESCSSREVNNRTDELSVMGIPNYSSLNFHELKADDFSFDPLGKNFHGVFTADASNAREASTSMMLDEHVEQEQQTCHHAIHEQGPVAKTASHAGKSSNPVSTVISSSLFQTSLALDDHYLVADTILQHENFQQAHQQQKQSERSASCLEEVIMRCTSGAVEGAGFTCHIYASPFHQRRRVAHLMILEYDHYTRGRAHLCWTTYQRC
ncbi:hypothetical protein ACLOJK_040090 [Asimina triloba]